MPEPTHRLRHQIENALAWGIIRTALALPYWVRVPAVGWMTSRVLAPLAGWNRRIRDNLALIYPDMPGDSIRRICRAATDNAGRAVIETYSHPEFGPLAEAAPLTGPGVAAFETARAEGRPVLIVSGHFGNYDAIVYALRSRGHPMGVLYRAMKNPLFNSHYVAALDMFCDRLFSADRQGVLGLVRHLKGGHIVGINLDQHNSAGAPVDFLGQPAMTALSAAEWALRFDALLVPTYAIRQPDGLRFSVFMDNPVPNGEDTVAVTARLNRSLARQVEEHPGQWFWIHRRWKGLPAR